MAQDYVPHSEPTFTNIKQKEKKMSKTFRKKLISGVMFTTLLSQIFNTCSYAIVEVTLDGHGFERTERNPNQYVITQNGSTYQINLPADFEANHHQELTVVRRDPGQRQDIRIRPAGPVVNGADIFCPDLPIFENHTIASTWIRENVRLMRNYRLNYIDGNTNQEFSFFWKREEEAPTIGVFNAESDDRTHKTRIFALLTLPGLQNWQNRFLVHTIDHTNQLEKTSRWYDGNNIKRVFKYTRKPQPNLGETWGCNVPGGTYHLPDPRAIDPRENTVIRSNGFETPQNGILVRQDDSSYIYSDGNRNFFLTRLLRGRRGESYVDIVYQSHKLDVHPELATVSGRPLPTGVFRYAEENIQGSRRRITLEKTGRFYDVTLSTDYYPFEVNTVPVGSNIEDIPYFKPLRSIILEDINITDEVAIMVGKTLEKKILKRLSLRNTQMNNEKLDKILENFTNINPSPELDYLNLGNRSPITLDDKRVSRLVRRFPQLKTLDLTNVLDDKGAKSLSNDVSRLTQLNTLDIYIPGAHNTYICRSYRGLIGRGCDFGRYGVYRFGYIPKPVKHVVNRIRSLGNLRTLNLRGVDFTTLREKINDMINRNRVDRVTINFID